MLRLERTLCRNTDIGGLLGAEFGQLRTQLVQVETSNFLIEMFRQHVDLLLVLAGVRVQLELRDHLVAELR